MHEKTIDVILPKLVCGYRTNSKFNLDRHSEKCNRSLNQNSTDHTCNICSKKFSSKKILTKHTKLHNRSKCDTPISASSCVVCKKTFVNTWNMERHTKKDHGLTEKGNVIENSAGIAIFTTEALVKEKVSETRAERLLLVKCVVTILSKKQISGDTHKSSMTEGQNQKCKEGKLRPYLRKNQTQEKGKEWKQSHRERGLLAWKESESVGA